MLLNEEARKDYDRSLDEIQVRSAERKRLKRQNAEATAWNESLEGRFQQAAREWDHANQDDDWANMRRQDYRAGVVLRGVIALVAGLVGALLWVPSVSAVSLAAAGSAIAFLWSVSSGTAVEALLGGIRAAGAQLDAGERVECAAIGTTAFMAPRGVLVTERRVGIVTSSGVGWMGRNGLTATAGGSDSLVLRGGGKTVTIWYVGPKDAASAIAAVLGGPFGSTQAVPSFVKKHYEQKARLGENGGYAYVRSETGAKMLGGVFVGNKRRDQGSVASLASGDNVKVQLLGTDEIVVLRRGIDEKKDDSPHWVPLQPSHYLYTGLFPQYCLAQVQGVLDDLDMADEVLVKFTPEDE